LAPATIFLGFALSALAMALVVFIVPGLGAPALLALFAFLSLVAWMVLRRVFRRQTSDVRIVTKDINDT
jgi:membrane protein implicated in regulation of membrane protease activity